MLRKALLPFAVLLLLLTGAQAAPEQPEPLDLTLLRVGKADAIVARCGGDVFCAARAPSAWTC